MGPAFIKEVHIVYDSTKTFNNSDELFRHIFKTNAALDTIPYSNSTFKAGYVLPANQSIDIITVKNRKGIEYFGKVLAEKSLDFSIIYEDVYGTRWKLTNEQEDNVPILISKVD